jgi:hypothetical protein
MADRARADIDLTFMAGAGSMSVHADTVVIYAPVGSAEVVLNGEAFSLPADGALRIDGMSSMLVDVRSGDVAVATIVMKR